MNCSSAGYELSSAYPNIKFITFVPVSLLKHCYDLCYSCHFSYVGESCDTACKCNQHSECAGVDQLDVCLDCKNNTMGSQCQHCKPLFVGDPRNGNTCVSRIFKLLLS